MSISLCMASCAGGHAESECASAIKIPDGEKVSWADVSDSVTFRCDPLVENPSDNEVCVKLAWTPDSLMMLFRVSDKNLRCIQTRQDHPKLFLDDMMEFLIDPRNDRGESWIEDDIIYHINLHGCKKDDRGTPEGISNPEWNGNARYTIHLSGSLNDDSDTDRGYIIEVALPWDELGVDPETGLVMGIDFTCGDNDGKGRQLFDWAGAVPFRHPVEFRDLILL